MGFFRKELSGGAFLVQLLEERCFLQVLSGVDVSSWVCTSTKFAFFISSFLAGKEAKEAGGTYEWFPLDPLSTFDGDAVPLDSPCSIGEGGRFSSS